MVKFMLNTQEFIYTVDMFRDILHLPVETLENPFVASVNIETIKAFKNRVGYQDVVDKGKKRKQNVGESSSPRNIHKIAIKKKKQSIPSIPPPGDDRKRDAIAEATLLSLTLYETALAAKAQENVAKVQEKLDEDEIEKMVKGDEDEELYASEFVDSVLNDNVDDSGTTIEAGSHKENPKNVDDDDEEIEKEKKDDVEIENEMKDDEEIEKEKKADEIENDDNIEKTDKVVTKKDIVDDMMQSNRSHIKNKFITHKFFMSKIREVLDHCNKVVPNKTFAKTNQEMLRLVNIVVNNDREVDPINAKEMIAKEFATHGPKMIEEVFRKHMHNTTLNLYPTTST
nr:hypothetical protein [Tanacetum cinerariifolium]